MSFTLGVSDRESAVADLASFGSCMRTILMQKKMDRSVRVVNIDDVSALPLQIVLESVLSSI